MELPDREKQAQETIQKVGPDTSFLRPRSFWQWMVFLFSLKLHFVCIASILFSPLWSSDGGNKVVSVGILVIFHTIRWALNKERQNVLDIPAEDWKQDKEGWQKRALIFGGGTILVIILMLIVFYLLMG